MKKLFFALMFIIVPTYALAATYQIPVATDTSYSVMITYYGPCCEEVIEGDGTIRTSYDEFQLNSDTWIDYAKLDFDLASLPVDLVANDIVNVTLNMNVLYSYNNPTVDIGGFFGEWAGGIKYAGTTQNVLVNMQGWTSFDFTDEFIIRYGLGDTSAYIEGVPYSPSVPYSYLEDLSLGYAISSIEAGAPAYLEITTTPIPGAIWLFGSGFFALIGIRRKFKNS